MEDKSLPAGLSSDQLAKLWSVGLDCTQECGPADRDQRRRDLLLDHLARSLPPDPALLDVLPQILSRLCQKLRPFSGEALRTLLLAPQSDLVVLENVKDYAKELGTRAGSDIEREVALALYFAAIAAALLHHRTKISEHSWKHLEQSFQTLSRRPWIPADLLQLFTTAAAYCKNKQ